jgi:hypothetical protein
MDEHKIIQIMPAGGWGARYEDDKGEYVDPLVGWALVDYGEYRDVVGLNHGSCTIELCDEISNFKGYVPPGE